MEKNLGLTMQEVLEYMYIKDTGEYSIEELVAGFCVGDIHRLPESFMIGVISELNSGYYDEDTFGDFKNKHDLESRLKIELGTESYLNRLKWLVEGSCKVIAVNVRKLFSKGSTSLKTAIYVRENMRTLRTISRMSFSLEESRQLQKTIYTLFKDTLYKGLEEQYSASALRVIQSLAYDDWDTGYSLESMVNGYKKSDYTVKKPVVYNLKTNTTQTH